MTPDERFKNYRNALLKRWQFGISSFKVQASVFQWMLFVKESMKESEFLWHTLSVHGEVAIMSLCILFERRKRNSSLLTLNKYLNFVQAHTELFKNIKSEKLMRLIAHDKNLIEESIQPIDKIMKYRDNVGAHLDKSFVLNMKIFTEETKLEYVEYESLYSLAYKIITQYSKLFDEKDLTTEIYEADIDDNEILNFVRLFIEKNETKED